MGVSEKFLANVLDLIFAMRIVSKQTPRVGRLYRRAIKFGAIHAKTEFHTLAAAPKGLAFYEG
jgi:hypothetical protein